MRHEGSCTVEDEILDRDARGEGVTEIAVACNVSRSRVRAVLVKHAEDEGEER